MPIIPLYFIVCFLSMMMPVHAQDDTDDDGDTLPPTLQPTITCTAYKTRFAKQINDLDGFIPQPIYTPRKIIPTDSLLSNYSFVQAVVGCDANGMFTGIGATLVAEEYEEKWQLLLIAFVIAFDQSITRQEAVAMLKDLADEATSNAKLNKSELNGFYGGEGNVEMGNYDISYSPIPEPKVFKIELRFETKKR